MSINDESTWDNLSDNSKKRYLSLLSLLERNNISVMEFREMNFKEFRSKKTGSGIKTKASLKGAQRLANTVYKSEIRQKQVEIEYKIDYDKRKFTPKEKLQKIQRIHETIHKLVILGKKSERQERYAKCVNILTNKFKLTRKESKQLLDYYRKTPKSELEVADYKFLEEFYY